MTTTEKKNPNKRPYQEGQVYRFAITWSIQGGMDLASFQAIHPKITEIFRQVSGKKGRFIFQLECTPRPEERKELLSNNHDNWHYQCYVNCCSKRRPKELRNLLSEMGMSNAYVTACSTAGTMALQNYCMKKDDTYRAGPWADRIIETTLPPYDGEDLPKDLYPWQDFILGRLRQKPDDRTWNWIFDPEGCMGKSTFVKYCDFHKKATTYSFMSADNLSYLVVKGGAKRAYLFDLPRTKGKHDSMKDIYRTLESIKNGNVKTGKYEGGHLIMPPPHVWVFSNYMPDFTAGSTDRITVWSPDSDTGELKCVHAPAQSVHKRHNWALIPNYFPTSISTASSQAEARPAIEDSPARSHPTTCDHKECKYQQHNSWGHLGPRCFQNEVLELHRSAQGDPSRDLAVPQPAQSTQASPSDAGKALARDPSGST